MVMEIGLFHLVGVYLASYPGHVGGGKSGLHGYEAKYTALSLQYMNSYICLPQWPRKDFLIGEQGGGGHSLKLHME